MSSAASTGAGLPIVVGVNGSEGSLVAVRYAAAEAARIGCDLHIVHVAPNYLPVESLVPAATLQAADFEMVGQTLLESSAEPAYEILPAERITTTVRLGYRATELLEAAKSARFLVVCDDRTPFLARLAVGEFVDTLAAMTSVPLIAVPFDWTPSADDPTAQRRIVLAIKDPQRIPFDLLRAGFEAASDHDAMLEITHVWDIPRGYGALVTAMMDDAAVRSILERTVRRMAEPLRSEFRGVRFSTSSRYGQAAHMLRAQSRGATLLLIARRPRAFPVGHFGATGRALLRESACPVEVLPIAERAGEVARSGRRPRERVIEGKRRAWATQRTEAVVPSLGLS